MSTVNELLGLNEVVDETIIVDISTRTIKIPPTLAFIGVESDDAVKRLYFKMPRYYGEFDLAQFEFRINCLNAVNGGDSVKIKDMKYGTDEITFTWLPERFMFVSKGHVEFNLCLRKIKGTGEDAVVEKEFNTTRASLPVLEGLETIERVMEAYPDLIQAWQEELFGRFNGRIDESLTVNGQAADAAEVGRRFGETAYNIINVLKELQYRASKDEVAVERKRIDQIVSSGTDVSGDTETIDARQDFNNVTHGSLGTSIRQTGFILDNVKQPRYGSFIELNGTLHTDAVYQVETKTEQTQTNGYYCEYQVSGETMLLVSGFAWSSYSVFPLGAFYDADGKLLKKIGSTNSIDFEDLLCYVPNDAVKLIVNGKEWYEPGVKGFVAGDLEGDIVEIQNTINSKIDISRLKHTYEKGMMTEVITLTEDNTELLEAQMYNEVGNLITGVISGGTYDTLYFPVTTYSSFLLDKYAVGTYGGAFVDKNKRWIKSFSTNYPNNLEQKYVPDNAEYIAITVNSVARYKSITAYHKTFDIKGLRMKLENIDSQWTGKKIVWIGTSVTFGQYAETSYPYEASKKLGFELVNASVPGTGIHTNTDGTLLTYGSLCLSVAEYAAQGWTIVEEPMDYIPGGSYNNYYRTYEHIFNEANADADLYVFDVAPNNGNFSLSDWDAFDHSKWEYKDGSSFADHRTTFLGALLFLMDKMYEVNPNARMAFALGSGFAYGEGKQAFKTIADKWNIPIIDLWGKINTSPKSISKIFSEDGTNAHPSTYAHELMGRMAVGELNTIA